MATTHYRASFYTALGSIEEVEVVRETEMKYVVKRRGGETMVSKNSRHERFFKTREEAKAEVVRRATQSVAHAKEALAAAERNLLKAHNL